MRQHAGATKASYPTRNIARQLVAAINDAKISLIILSVLTLVSALFARFFWSQSDYLVNVCASVPAALLLYVFIDIPLRMRSAQHELSHTIHETRESMDRLEWLLGLSGQIVKSGPTNLLEWIVFDGKSYRLQDYSFDMPTGSVMDEVINHVRASRSMLAYDELMEADKEARRILVNIELIGKSPVFGANKSDLKQYAIRLELLVSSIRQSASRRGFESSFAVGIVHSLAALQSLRAVLSLQHSASPWFVREVAQSS
jgi:hypothetical protein